MSSSLTKFITVMPPCAAGALPRLPESATAGALVSIQADNLHFVGVRLFQSSALRSSSIEL